MSDKNPWDDPTAAPIKVERKPRERSVQQRGDRYAKSLGFEAYKVRVVGQDGFPDKVYMGHGLTIWWEWKKKGKKPEPHQYNRMTELRAAGQVHVGWSDNFEEFKNYVDALL